MRPIDADAVPLPHPQKEAVTPIVTPGYAAREIAAALAC